MRLIVSVGSSPTFQATHILDMLKAVVDHEKLVQHEYERAHQRIHESRKYGGDTAAATVERIKGITNPHKLVGTYHAALDHGLGDAAKFCKERLHELHGRRIKSFPPPSKKVHAQVGKVRKTEPKAPDPQKGQTMENYHRTIFHHYRKLGRSHAQAHAIAYSMKERAAEGGHQFSKSLDRPDMVGPRPLQPPTQDRSLTHMREEPSRSVVREQAPLPVTRPGASGAHAPAPPQPALVIKKSLTSEAQVPKGIVYHPKASRMSEARATTLHNQAHEESITEHHAKVETHENRAHSSDDPAVKAKHRRAVNFHKNAIAAHHAAREAFGTKGYEQASDRAIHATDQANAYSMKLEGEGQARKSLELLLTKAIRAPKLNLPDPNKPGHVRISAPALQHHLGHGTYSLISAGRNWNDAKEKDLHENHSMFRERHQKLKGDLDKHGYAYTEVKGKWGGSGERSFMVYHKPHAEDGNGNGFMVHHKGPGEFAHMRKLAKKYNQSAVIHSHQGNHECHYVTGESAGQHEKGSGFEMKPGAEDNYTEMSHPHRKASRFALHIGEEKHPMDSAVLKSILERMAKAQIIRMPPETANTNLQPEPTRGVSYPTQVVARDYSRKSLALWVVPTRGPVAGRQVLVVRV